MALEIERKYLVTNEQWKSIVSRARRIRQAYLTNNDNVSVRIRIYDDTAAKLTMKAAQAEMARHEFEYDIPIEDAETMIEHRNGSIIEKVRHDIPIGDVVWEVDVFAGDNAGLVLAEVELKRSDQEFDKPSWIGREVTSDRRFYNADLVQQPYREFKDAFAKENYE